MHSSLLINTCVDVLENNGSSDDFLAYSCYCFAMFKMNNYLLFININMNPLYSPWYRLHSSLSRVVRLTAVELTYAAISDER